MQTFLVHSAPLIALMLIALKGGDFVLRPHQQRQVQEFAEDWALRLSYIRPLDALKPVMSRRGQTLTLAAAGILFLWMLVYGFLFQTSGSRVGDLFTSIFAVAFLAVPTFIVAARIGPKVAGWVFGDGRFLPFAARSAVYFFLCWAVIATLQKTVAAFGPPHPLGLGWVVAIPLCAALFVVILAVVGFGGLWWIMTATFFLVAAAHGLVRTAEVLVRLASGLTWRVAEYNKGAWVAIVLVTTFCFGVADFALHYKG